MPKLAEKTLVELSFDHIYRAAEYLTGNGSKKVNLTYAIRHLKMSIRHIKKLRQANARARRTDKSQSKEAPICPDN